MPIVTLTTDFGSTDPFFGIMKGVILTICPEAKIEDITHDISPQDIWQANFILQASYHYFPKRTIHVCVVDPGVGSKRRPILIESKDYFFIGPDNGIFTGILEMEKIINIIALTEKKYWLQNVSQTFHGRDIFSPVAAHIAKMILETQQCCVSTFGKTINTNDLVRLPVSKPIKKENGYSGAIQFIDHFGNLITNIPNKEVPENITGKVKTFNFNGLVSSFAEANDNKLTAIKGSSGFVEIFVKNGNAEKITGVQIKDNVDLNFSS